MNLLLDQLNDILTDWRKQFDIFSSVFLAFTEDDRGQLRFNGMPLCLICDLTLDHAQFDAEQVLFCFEDRRELQIDILWPEEETPYAGSVSLRYPLSRVEDT